MDDAPPSSALHATAEEGVSTRAIAEAIGRGLDLPVVSIPADQASDHFGWMALFSASTPQRRVRQPGNRSDGIPCNPDSSLTSTPATTFKQ